MTEQSLMVKNQSIPSESEFNVLQTIARNANASGLYGGVGSEHKIFMVLLAARELGIPPMTALNGGLWNIQGKVELSARMINSMLRKAGISIKIKRLDPKGCILEGIRPDSGDSCIVQFLEEDAARAGVLNRKPWKENPEDMYFARAISKLGRRLAPDILGTAYVEGEIKGELQETTYEVVEETSESVDSMLKLFFSNYEDCAEDYEKMKEYLQKYANHWKKTIPQTLNDYSDKEKFLNDFNKWKSKQEKKVSNETE